MLSQASFGTWSIIRMARTPDAVRLRAAPAWPQEGSANSDGYWDVRNAKGSWLQLH